MYIVASYVAYLALSLAATIWVGSTLHRHGRIFLVNAFHGNAEMADSVNRLLVVGFYLVNIGYVALALRTAGNLATARAAIELVSDKIGVVLLVLGAMHFGNIYIFNRLRTRPGPARFGSHPAPPPPPAMGRVLD